MRRDRPAANSLPSGIITAMFTDIVDSTRIKSQMEGETSARRDTRFRELIKEPHDAVVLACVREAKGHIVNPTGDGFCVAFVDAEEAVLCALRIQKHLTEHPIDTPAGPLQIRIGLHTGIAGASGDDYIASAVDKTARVQSQATAGQVFVSHQTQVLVADRTRGIRFEPRGIFDLKGLQAEELYQVIPEATLKLPPVVPQAIEGEAGETAQGSFTRPARKTTLPRLWLGVGLCALFLAIGAGAIFLPPRLRPEPVLPVGSQWNGSFHFLPPMDQYDGAVAMHINKREGDSFSGVYSSENQAYQWLIEGTVKGKSLRWEFVKSLKNPGTEDAVGKAYGEATVDGDRMKGFFRMKTDVKEVAALDLRATK